MGSRPAYASRESLALALDRGLNVLSIEGLDRALNAATDAIEQELERVFWPWYGTRTFDVPADDTSTSTPTWRLWLDPHDLISLESLTVGGSAVSGYQLRPDNRVARPAEWIELDRAGSTSFRDGSSASPQRRVAGVGLWGWWDESRAAGTLQGGALVASTAIDIATAPTVGTGGVGVGHLLRVGDERMVVTERGATDTGENLAEALAASASNSIPSSITVGDGTDYAAGEMLMIGGELLLITRVLSNTLFVRRGYAGTPVASHAIGADIWAFRRLYVTRGAAGTTAAAHDSGAAVTRWQAPYAIEALCIAIAQEIAVQEGAAQARTVGGGDNEREARATGLRAAWDRARAYTRKRGRHYAV